MRRRSSPAFASAKRTPGADCRERKSSRSGTPTISDDSASLAHADLIALSVELVPYEPFAERVWQLRANLTSYDAWYVAVAEAFDAPLATLDVRLSRAAGPTCTFVVPG